MAEQVMLTEREIKLIKHSWSRLAGIEPVVIGDVFYRKLFLDIPEVKRMFTTSREVQSRKLLDMLSLVVARLERSHEISEDIRQLARRHAGYGVKEEHYNYVGNALIWTLQQALREEWNPELESAWVNCYRNLSGAMIEAAR
jgi:hemoglobin-like flavoprotein